MFRTRSCKGRGPRAKGQGIVESTATPSAPGPRPSAPGPRPSPLAQEGYTLAALIVVLTIIAIVVAYTVPTQWSLIMRREREKQTIFYMKQFARAIFEWERKHQGLPVSLEQLQKASKPRFLRGGGKWPMPLTGREDDWIMVPPNAIEAVAGGGAVPPPGQAGVGIGRPPGAANPAGGGANPAGGAPGQPGKLNPQASPKDYVGPFVAVRPNAAGPSLVALNGAEDYSQWVYTLQDLKNEMQARQMALSMPK